MRLHQVLLPLLLISYTLASTQAQTNFVLPDLGINNVNPTCDNVQNLINIANSDLTRLTNFANGDLASAIKNAQQALTLAQQACNVQNTLRPALLETQNTVKGKSATVSASTTASRVTSAFAKIYTKLNSQKFESELGTSAIAQHAQETAQTLIKLHETAVSQAEQGNVGLNDVCNAAITAIQTLANYLSSLNAKVSGAVSNDLPQRIKTLTSFNTDCTSPITLTGQVAKSYIGTNNPIVLLGQNSVRTDDITVQFKQPFSVVPSVGLGLLGFDLNPNYNRVQLDIVSITNANFVVRVSVLNQALIAQIQFSWIATITPKSGIYIYTNKINKDADADLKAIVTQGATRSRFINRILPNIPNLSNMQSLIAINSYDFGGLARINLDTPVSADPAQVSYNTWDDSKFQGVGTTIIFFSGDDKTTDVTYSSNKFCGPLYTGNGNRTDSITPDLSGYKSQPEIFVALSRIDMWNTDGFRLLQPWTGTYPNLGIKVQTWDGSKIGGISDVFLTTCTYNDKSKCK